MLTLESQSLLSLSSVCFFPHIYILLLYPTWTQGRFDFAFARSSDCRRVIYHLAVGQLTTLGHSWSHGGGGGGGGGGDGGGGDGCGGDNGVGI